VVTPLFTKTNKPEIKQKIAIGHRAGDVQQNACKPHVGGVEIYFCSLGLIDLN
jgi:hypothetical protein